MARWLLAIGILIAAASGSGPHVAALDRSDVELLKNADLALQKAEKDYMTAKHYVMGKYGPALGATNIEIEKATSLEFSEDFQFLIRLDPSLVGDEGPITCTGYITGPTPVVGQ